MTVGSMTNKVHKITMARCTACGKIAGGRYTKVHSCYVIRNEWGEKIADHYEPTELVDFKEVPGSAREND